jgi:hypothetical protein
VITLMALSVYRASSVLAAGMPFKYKQQSPAE